MEQRPTMTGMCIHTLTSLHSLISDKIKENEMVGAGDPTFNPANYNAERTKVLFEVLGDLRDFIDAEDRAFNEYFERMNEEAGG